MTMSTLLTKAQWAELHGVSTKTVDRWLAAGQIPGAVRQAGRWFFPEGTPRPQGEASHGGTSQDVPGRPTGVAAGPPSSPGGSPIASAALTVRPSTAASTAAPVAVGGTLEEFAAMAGCSPSGVRRLFADVAAAPGLPFYVGRYGPRGALRAVAFPGAGR